MHKINRQRSVGVYAKLIKSGHLWGVECDQKEERGASLTFSFYLPLN